MALSGVVDLPGEQGEKLRIEFKNNGRELYWVNDELIQDISASGTGKSHNRKVPLNGHDIELRYSFSGKQSFADLYIDGLLYKKDIFSIEKTLHSAAPSAGLPIKTLLVLVGIFIVLALVISY